MAFFPTIRLVPLERNPDQTRQVNRQPSARHSINSNDFIVSLGVVPQPPETGSQSRSTRKRQGLQSYGHSSYRGEVAMDLEGHSATLVHASRECGVR